MPNPSIREVSVWPYPYTGTPYKFAIVADDKISGGKRAIERNYDPANATTRRERVQWEIWGPIGASLQSSAGGLGVDFARNLDTRWERQLLPRAAQTTVDLTPFDPPGTGSYYGEYAYGTKYYGSGAGGSGGDGPDVVVFAEQNGYLLVLRGSLLTQVDMTTTPWTVVSTTALDAVARDAEHWRGTVKVALGPTAPTVRVVSANPAGVTLAQVDSTTPSAGPVYTSAIKVGSDRVWFIDADENGVSFNYANYALDDFVNLSAAFQVGDPDVGTTGIGPFGPFTQFGSEDGIYSFTDQGKPIPQSRALTSLHSDLNGYQFADPGWTWNYYTAITGLRANHGGTDNPVGIGERMRGFTGHSGLPHAVYQVRGELPVVYHTPEHAGYGYRCTFGPETGGTGQPLLWPWYYDAAGHCHAIYSSTTGVPNQDGVWLIRAKGTNLTYELIAANGLDELYSNYEYAAVGDGASWTVQAAFDADPNNPVAATYVTIGSVTTNGGHTIVPDDGATTGQGNPSPTTGISGRTIKPRIRLTDESANTYDAYLTTLDQDPNLVKTLRLVRIRAQGMGSETRPPSLLGTLEAEYDARPELVENIDVAINLTGTAYSDNKVWQLFRELDGQQTTQPMRIQISDDLPPSVSKANGGGQKYAFVTAVRNRSDIKDGDIEGATLSLSVWPQADAL